MVIGVALGFCFLGVALYLEVNRKSGFMWGDTGRLYFYVYKEDLKIEEFSDVWMERPIRLRHK